MASVNNITISILDKTFTDFKSFRIVKDIEQFGNSADITVSIPATQKESSSGSNKFVDDSYIKIGNPVVIYIDQEPILTGFIDVVRKDSNNTDTNISLTVRDKISDFIDSKVQDKVFSPSTTFEKVLEDCLKIVGYKIISPNKNNLMPSSTSQNEIAIINNYGTIEPFTDGNDLKMQRSVSAFELVQNLADKRSLILNTDGNGNIVIQNIGQEQAPTILQKTLSKESSNELNNIITSSMKENLQDRFYEYKVISVIQNSSKFGTDSNGDLIENAQNHNTQYSGVVYDLDVRPTRKLLIAIGGLNNQQCKERAKWELNIRKSRSFVYDCEVFGFRQNLLPVSGDPASIALNPLWKPNQKVYLTDEEYKLEDEYLIKSVEYSQSNEGGSKTKLTLVDKNSFTDSIFEPIFRKQRKSLGDIRRIVG